MTIFKPLPKPERYMPDTWLPKDEPILAGRDMRCEFAPMLQVDIKTGKILVDRRDEVLPRKQRGGMYGRW